MIIFHDRPCFVDILNRNICEVVRDETGVVKDDVGRFFLKSVGLVFICLPSLD